VAVSVQPAAEAADDGRRGPVESLRVLLAEDNPVNRIVAMRTLEKRGHRVKCVENGAEAVKAFEECAFDVILMDVQMPSMDGLEATARIREKERCALGRVPIIALTAHAMKGDRERCLAAGMDDYLTKPFKAEDLVRAVESRPAEIAADGTSRRPVLDHRALLERVEGDRALAGEIAEVFLEEGVHLMERIRTAMRGGDFDAINKSAHRLRGTLSTIGAERAAAPALRLELATRDGRAEPREEDLAELEEEIARLRPELLELAATRCSKFTSPKPAADPVPELTPLSVETPIDPDCRNHSRPVA
jgi:CheY-like chemotaxis protein